MTFPQAMTFDPPAKASEQPQGQLETVHEFHAAMPTGVTVGSDGIAARTVLDEGDKGGAADGLESDADGRLYATNDEHNAVLRRQADGRWEAVVYDPRLLWPDIRLR